MSSLYLTIALLYTLIFLVVVVSLCAIAQLPMGIHSSETIAQRLSKIYRDNFQSFSIYKTTVLRKMFPISVKTSPHN